MPPPIDDALAGYKRLSRSLLNSKTARWRDLDITMQQLRALYFLRDEKEASVGRLAELFAFGLPAASVLADRLVSELREGSHTLLRRWMTALSRDELEALARGWNALADVAAGARDRETTT